MAHYDRNWCNYSSNRLNSKAPPWTLSGHFFPCPLTSSQWKEARPELLTTAADTDCPAATHCSIHQLSEERAIKISALPLSQPASSLPAHSSFDVFCQSSVLYEQCITLPSQWAESRQFGTVLRAWCSNPDSDMF